jgi:8-hydroxy-5-deazaflavin:NADPH oxidoreductase
LRHWGSDTKIGVIGAGQTTNQFGSGPMPERGQTAASFNSLRVPGARYVKSFNTLTAALAA